MVEHLDQLPRTRPLARSLDPLVGESVKGYLLRLSYRLRVTPVRLARMTGCADNLRYTHISHSLLLSLDTRTFARITRLSDDEAAALTFIPWADRYPPITTATRRAPKRDGWLMITDAVRYCPHCLAGDGSPIQEQYGGPWKTIWHLPIVFACPQHCVFLRNGCPKNHPPRRELSRLITRAGDDDLHPAQCRQPFRNHYGPGSAKWTPTCGERLDKPAIIDRQDVELLRTQQRLLDLLLVPRCPSGAAARYFTDLRTASSLLRASWPLGQEFVHHELAPAIAAHAHNIETGPKSDALPRDPAATGALLAAAMSLLDNPDRETTLERHIRAVWPGPPHTSPWRDLLGRSAP